MTETAALKFKPVTAARWGDFEKLFSAKGSPSYCWCMAWRSTPEELKQTKTDEASRKRAMHERVMARVPIGLLGYLAGEPVAWCSVAPSTTFRGLRSDVEPDRKVWSITCFFIRREHRSQGLARALLDAAVAYAKKRGASVVEGYPVEESSPSYRHMGFVPMFRAAKFREVAKAGTRRHVMRKKAA